MRNQHKMPGDWLFKVVPVFIGIVFVAIVCVWIAAVYFGSKAIGALDGCTPALVTSESNGQTQTSIECKK